MTLNDIQNALSFLQRVYVGRGDEERFLQTIDALKKELNKRSKQPATK